VKRGPLCIHNQPVNDDQAALKDAAPVATPTPSFSPGFQHLKQPAIAQVNRLLREEGLKLFYQKNVFHGVNWCVPLPRDWIKQIDERWRRRMVVFTSSGWEAQEVISHMAAAGIR
jgi:hypothetical protein